jgi:hypothetical protein
MTDISPGEVTALAFDIIEGHRPVASPPIAPAR